MGCGSSSDVVEEQVEKGNEPLKMDTKTSDNVEAIAPFTNDENDDERLIKPVNSFQLDETELNSYFTKPFSYFSSIADITEQTFEEVIGLLKDSDYDEIAMEFSFPLFTRILFEQITWSTESNIAVTYLINMLIVLIEKNFLNEIFIFNYHLEISSVLKNYLRYGKEVAIAELILDFLILLQSEDHSDEICKMDIFRMIVLELKNFSDDIRYKTIEWIFKTALDYNYLKKLYEECGILTICSQIDQGKYLNECLQIFNPETMVNQTGPNYIDSEEEDWD
eukprot:TRINITY_DN1760_c1_g1_i1.p1 TRINITY_DN1760_c1_g1~~TRINITY_DN1760_c1_g1_i1.p1  ORF type:complete len:279 (+),score=89.14 TRINITY_DN1760_c1_g1_i1:56-892(+)